MPSGASFETVGIGVPAPARWRARVTTPRGHETPVRDTHCSWGGVRRHEGRGAAWLWPALQPCVGKRGDPQLDTRSLRREAGR
eukprot:7388841-Prymnesium_polylepis.1